MDDTSRGVSARDTDLDPESARRARQLEGEIASTRAEMSETIEAIQERLRPSNLVADATDRVKAATTEKVKSMADTASGTAQGMMRETRERASDLVEGARQNPVPALMIGAGVAWLLIDRARKSGNGHSDRDDDRYGRPSARYGYPGTDYYANPYDRDLRSSSYGRDAEGIASRARQTAEEAGQTVRRTAARTQNGLQRLLKENPLLVGAAAVLVGATVGASLPETERENEWMGETRDSVLDRAQEAARGAVDTVREVAEDAVEKVTDKVTPAS